MLFQCKKIDDLIKAFYNCGIYTICCRQKSDNRLVDMKCVTNRKALKKFENEHFPKANCLAGTDYLEPLVNQTSEFAGFRIANVNINHDYKNFETTWIDIALSPVDSIEWTSIGSENKDKWSDIQFNAWKSAYDIYMQQNKDQNSNVDRKKTIEDLSKDFCKNKKRFENLDFSK